MEALKESLDYGISKTSYTLGSIWFDPSGKQFSVDDHAEWIADNAQMLSSEYRIDPAELLELFNKDPYLATAKMLESGWARVSLGSNGRTVAIESLAKRDVNSSAIDYIIEKKPEEVILDFVTDDSVVLQYDDFIDSFGSLSYSSSLSCKCLHRFAKCPTERSRPVLEKLRGQGYTTAKILSDFGCSKCKKRNGQVLTLDEVIDGAEHDAPIFTLTHPGCLCKLKITGDDLDAVFVDYSGKVEE